jgi:hypothetical protein
MQIENLAKSHRFNVKFIFLKSVQEDRFFNTPIAYTLNIFISPHKRVKVYF